ncbi:exosortase U [Rhodopirellula bahusiensis]|uniref:exosortase U n=1 Tax=Rhodopirellula bahusiensis TaxID=2014065 RepID=UPI003263D45D
MASASTSHPNLKQTVSDGQPKQSWKIWWLPISVLLALAPLLHQYFTWTWLKGHYQYFPLLIASVIALTWHRWDEAQRSATPARRSNLAAGLGAVVLLAFLGYVLWTGLLGIVAASLAAVILIYGWIGWGGLKPLLPGLSLLILAIPLPLSLDTKLIFNMQFVASGLADLLLDGAGVWHVREGVLLITEHGRYMTEEACSGVRSLFSSLAVVAVFSVVSRHRWQRTAINLVQTILWVLIGNAVRVAASVALADYVSPWFASGSGHELLSFLVFAFILGMVANTDAILATLLGEHVSWYDETYAISPNSTSDAVPAQSPPSVNAFTGSGRSFNTIFACLFSFLCLFGLLTWRISQPVWTISATDANSLSELTENDLPIKINNWERVSFEHVQRGDGAMMARNSYTWNYTNGQIAATVSVDCPWSSWHNLNQCYRAIGWETSPSYFIASREGVPWENLSFSNLEISRPNSDQSGRVLFTVVDANRNEVQSDHWRYSLQSPTRFFRTALNRLQNILTATMDPNSRLALPASTIQLLIEHGEALTPEENEAIESFFYDARKQLLEGRRWSGRPSAGNDEINTV